MQQLTEEQLEGIKQYEREKEILISQVKAEREEKLKNKSSKKKAKNVDTTIEK